MDPQILDVGSESENSEQQKDAQFINRRKRQHQTTKFRETVSLMDRYFQVAETSIRELRDTAEDATKNQADRQLDKKRRQILNAGQTALNEVNDELKKLQIDLAKLKTEEEREWTAPGNEANFGKYSADYRMQNEILQAATKRFVAVCHAFSDASINTKAAIENKIKRLIRTTAAGANLSEDQLNQAMEAGGMEQMFQMALRTETEADEILQTAIYKNTICRDINRTAQEVRQMTLDFAVLIQSQSETIDRIEGSVILAKEHVEKGIVNLQKANNAAKSTRKWLKCGICIFVIVLAVVLLIVMGIIRK